MKGYEAAARTVLPRRMPVIIRCDGKAFHTYTRGCKKPFDETFGDVMLDAAKALVSNVQGTQLAYVQSDEISVLVHNYKRFNSEAWFNNQVQKMVSTAAGIVSSHFTANSWKIWCASDGFVLKNERPAVFDARAFIVPEEDICNYFLWRQQDATRNSIQMLARSLYSHKECDHKNTSELQEMCFLKGANWNDLEARWKRGVCIRRKEVDQDGDGHRCVEGCQHSKSGDRLGNWHFDYNIPLFNEDSDYVNGYLFTEE